jgi:hypothetical protein
MIEIKNIFKQQFLIFSSDPLKCSIMSVLFTKNGYTFVKVAVKRFFMIVLMHTDILYY